MQDQILENREASVVALCYKEVVKNTAGLGSEEDVIRHLLPSSVKGRHLQKYSKSQLPGRVRDETVWGRAIISKGTKINGLEAAMGSKDDIIPTSACM